MNLIRVMPAKGQDKVMQASYLIARIAGPVLTSVGLGIVVSREAYRAIAAEFLDNIALIYAAGVGMMTIGLTILNMHPAWTRDWRSLITMLGWMLTGIGCFRIFAPDLVIFVGAVASPTFMTFVTAFLLGVGGFLTFKGYAAEQPQRQRKELHS